MAAPKINSAPIQILTRATAETAILEGAALYYSTSADDTVVLPAGAASTLKFAGAASEDQTSGADNIQVVTQGVARMVAGGAITQGDSLESAGATGRVQTATTGTVIGHALTSAGAAGNVVAVELIKVA